MKACRKATFFVRQATLCLSLYDR
ncbi:hypothetical protein SPHINGO8AM_60017 [Sphingomonas sp. 8AM]|nr:hypothetical protein SPHINGO8AM_60017 [Sphingomonas sp. 8AM]